MYLREIKYDERETPDFTQYPFSLPVLNSPDFCMKFTNPVTFLVGENGTGKSTILEAIALSCGFNAAGGSRNNLYTTHKTESPLSDKLLLVWNQKATNGFFMRAETFFNFATSLEDMGSIAFNSYGGKSLHQQSHGESFLALFNNRVNQGLYIFDEPEAALSPQRQLALLAILNDRVKNKNCQFIIATHSPILITYPGADIYELTGNQAKKVKFHETTPYKITKDFLNNPEAFHRHLFE